MVCMSRQQATQNGGPAIRSLNALDIEILRFLTRFAMARPHHVVAWTGASPHTVKRRLPALAAAGLTKSSPVNAALRGADGRVRDAICTVWTTTRAGAALAGDWTVPGSEVRVSLPVPRPSALLTHHTLGAVDLACWYRLHGFEVAAEREIRSTEQPSALTPDRQVTQFWTTRTATMLGVHPPDLGVVAPDGGVWAVELERSTKTVADYRSVIAAYRNAGMGQVWHISSQATARRIMEACQYLGILWQKQPEEDTAVSVAVSAGDGLVRLQPWMPGRSGLGQPSTWETRRLFPRTAPAGFPALTERPDFSTSWRKGRIIDMDDESTILGGVML